MMQLNQQAALKHSSQLSPTSPNPVQSSALCSKASPHLILPPHTPGFIPLNWAYPTSPAPEPVTCTVFLEGLLFTSVRFISFLFWCRLATRMAAQPAAVFVDQVPFLGLQAAVLAMDGSGVWLALAVMEALAKPQVRIRERHKLIGGECRPCGQCAVSCGSRRRWRRRSGLGGLAPFGGM